MYVSEPELDGPIDAVELELTLPFVFSPTPLLVFEPYCDRMLLDDTDCSLPADDVCVESGRGCCC